MFPEIFFLLKNKSEKMLETFFLVQKKFWPGKIIWSEKKCWSHKEFFFPKKKLSPKQFWFKKIFGVPWGIGLIFLLTVGRVRGSISKPQISLHTESQPPSIPLTYIKVRCGGWWVVGGVERYFSVLLWAKVLV